jgi:ribosomal protein S18 acetylase RimI-like enzyme
MIRRPAGLLLYSRGILFPVFHLSPSDAAEFLAGGIPLPPFFSPLQSGRPLHAAQGPADDMDLLETALDRRGLFASLRWEYELRGLDLYQPLQGKAPGDDDRAAPDLVIRRPETEDLDALYPLQMDYEREEVLPPGAEFNPAACRAGLEYLIKTGMILIACLKDQVVGKININAQSFTRFQIGGVYVLPGFRGQGIARAMTAALIRLLAPRKKRFTLFVKKTNIPARRVYDYVGFSKIADYRINYYRTGP